MKAIKLSGGNAFSRMRLLLLFLLILIGIPAFFTASSYFEYLRLKDRTKSVVELWSSDLANAIKNKDYVFLRKFSQGLLADEVKQIGIKSDNVPIIAVPENFVISDCPAYFNVDIERFGVIVGDIEVCANTYSIFLGQFKSQSVLFFGILTLLTFAGLTLTPLFSYRRSLLKFCDDLRAWADSVAVESEDFKISNQQFNDPLGKEIFNLIDNGIRLKLESLRLRNELSTASAVSVLSKQVAHDIRSPLSALNIATHGLTAISEDRRLLIRNAIQRINDIANDLLKKSQESQRSSAGSPGIAEQVSSMNSSLLLPAVIDSIISEKRIQFRDRIDVRIEVDLGNSFGVFVKANSSELSRIISNLVNNSVEALPNSKGQVVVSVTGENSEAKIRIKDNGCGMSQETLAKLGIEGFSSGKEGTTSGNGLGIHHARKTLEKWGGAIEFKSDLGVGTEVVVTLPCDQHPIWFASEIVIEETSTLVIVDDDLSIHQIWKGRLESLMSSKSGIKCLNFTSAREFLNLSIDDSMMFLIDYEFLNQNENGIELIRNRGIAKRSILVTSRHEEPHVREGCGALGVKIVPKQLAGYVPIRIQKV